MNLLIGKERRNFEEHTFITDFMKHSFNTNDARFTTHDRKIRHVYGEATAKNTLIHNHRPRTLLRQQGLLTEFQLSEIDVLDKTYMKYFGHLHRQNLSFEI